MRFTLTIDCDNAAFGETHGERCDQIARILHDAADGLDGNPSDNATLRDSNGNTVGSYTLTEGGGTVALLRGLLSCYADPRFRVTPAFTRRVAAALEATKAEG